MGNDNRPGNVEPELVPVQGRLGSAVLLDFMRDGIQHVIAKILVNTPVPAHSGTEMLLRRSGAARTHPPLVCQDFKFLRGTIERRGSLRGRLRFLLGAG